VLNFSITLSVYPAVNGYLTLFSAGEGESVLGKVKAVRKSSDALPQLYQCHWLHHSRNELALQQPLSRRLLLTVIYGYGSNVYLDRITWWPPACRECIFNSTLPEHGKGWINFLFCIEGEGETVLVRGAHSPLGQLGYWHIPILSELILFKGPVTRWQICDLAILRSATREKIPIRVPSFMIVTAIRGLLGFPAMIQPHYRGQWDCIVGVVSRFFSQSNCH